MLKPIRSILFATDLTQNCQSALDFTIVMAIRFKATIYMLHVIERVPLKVKENLEFLLGKHEWEKIVTLNQEDIRKSMTGKQTTDSRVKEAVYNFCKDISIEEESCDFQSSQIIIKEGNIAEEIITNAVENECDLIVLGGHKSMFSDAPSVGGTTKAVLKNAKIPVTIFPPIAS